MCTRDKNGFNILYCRYLKSDEIFKLLFSAELDSCGLREERCWFSNFVVAPLMFYLNLQFQVGNARTITRAIFH
jgi:hypothetical protein